MVTQLQATDGAAQLRARLINTLPSSWCRNHCGGAEGFAVVQLGRLAKQRGILHIPDWRAGVRRYWRILVAEPARLLYLCSHLHAGSPHNYHLTQLALPFPLIPYKLSVHIHRHGNVLAEAPIWCARAHQSRTRSASARRTRHGET